MVQKQQSPLFFSWRGKPPGRSARGDRARTFDIRSRQLLSERKVVSRDDLGRPTRVEYNGNPDDHETFRHGCRRLLEHRSHDANGNLTSDGRNTYGWNVENRLVKVARRNGTRVRYKYDPSATSSASPVKRAKDTCASNSCCKSITLKMVCSKDVRALEILGAADKDPDLDSTTIRNHKDAFKHEKNLRNKKLLYCGRVKIFTKCQCP